MYKWINTLTEGWKQVRYINVGEVNNNCYLGWKKLRSNKQYVTVNPTTGNIDWYYNFDNGSWHKKDVNGVEYLWTPTEFTLTLAVNDESYGAVSASVASPNVYDDTTGKVTQNTVAKSVITLTATPETGYEVIKWKRGDTDIEDSAVETLEVEENSNVTYTAVFDESV
jgi:hypothetical protein